ncbi:MAG TPA: type II toxin-antitoxin system RelE/ParE family toxin [Pirellulales bacterium]|jgi:toxin ParE1/3/4
MSRRVERTPEAALDLRAIAGHIAQNNPSAAHQWLREMEALFSILATQPEMGQRMQTQRFGVVRQISRGNYVVYYRPHNDGVEILRIIHGARDHNQLV